jgi:type II secretion system protein L
MRLRVWLPPLEDLRADSSMEFEVIDARRRVINRGEAVIAALPKGIDCELVLDALDVVLLDVKPPKLSGARLGKALPGLVEDRLAGDVERNHVVATRRDVEGHATAAVVDRALLRRALEIFERAGRRVIQATPQPLALNFSPGGWRVRWHNGKGSVRTGPTTGTAFASTAVPPLEVRLLLSQSAQPPNAIEVEGDCDVRAWSEALGIVVKAGRVSEQAAPVDLDLLQYEFSQSVVRWQAWRSTMVLGGVLLLTALGGLNLHAWTLRAKEKELREAMTEIVRESFPQVPVVLDPLAQMQRHTSELRTGAGTERGGFLAMATALGQLVDPGSVQSIDYRDGRFTARFRPQTAYSDSQQAKLSERADRMGLVLRFAGDSVTLAQKTSP